MFFEIKGTKHFGPVIDITDPIYDRKVWCRINSLPIKEGDYKCAVGKVKHSLETDEGTVNETCCTVAGIYLDNIPDESSLEEIGFVGVDSGRVGFFNGEYEGGEDEEVFVKNGDSKIDENGFYAFSHKGTSLHRVYAQKNDEGEIVSLEIVLI